MKIKIKEKRTYQFIHCKCISYLIEDLFVFYTDLDNCKLVINKLNKFEKVVEFIKILKYELQKTIPLDIRYINEDILISPLFKDSNFNFNFLLEYNTSYCNGNVDILSVLCEIFYKDECLYRAIVYENGLEVIILMINYLIKLNLLDLKKKILKMSYLIT